eukprot:tig00000691_g3173.t1
MVRATRKRVVLAAVLLLICSNLAHAAGPSGFLDLLRGRNPDRAVQSPTSRSLLQTSNLPNETDWWMSWQDAYRSTASDADETSALVCDKSWVSSGSSVHCTFFPRKCNAPIDAEPQGFIAVFSHAEAPRMVFFGGDVADRFDFTLELQDVVAGGELSVRRSTDAGGPRVGNSLQIAVAGVPDETSSLDCGSSVRQRNGIFTCTYYPRLCGKSVSVALSSLVLSPENGQVTLTAEGELSDPQRGVPFIFSPGSDSGPASLSVMAGDVETRAEFTFVARPAAATIDCRGMLAVPGAPLSCSVSFFQDEARTQPVYVAAPGADGPLPVDIIASGGSLAASFPDAFRSASFQFTGAVESVGYLIEVYNDQGQLLGSLQIPRGSAPPPLSAQPSPLHFGDVFRGFPAVRSLNVTNTGSSVATYNLTISWAVVVPYGAVSVEFNPKSITLGPSDQIEVSVVLVALEGTPAEPFSLLASVYAMPLDGMSPLFVSSIDATLRQAVSLRDPRAIETAIFRPVALTAQIGRLHNELPNPLELDVAGLPPGVSVNPPPPATLAAGASWDVNITFDSSAMLQAGRPDSKPLVYVRGYQGDPRRVLFLFNVSSINVEPRTPAVEPTYNDLRFIFSNVNATSKIFNIRGNFPAFPPVDPSSQPLAFWARDVPPGISFKPASGDLHPGAPQPLNVTIDHTHFSAKRAYEIPVSFDVGVKNRPTFNTTVVLRFEMRDPDQIPTDWWKPWEGASRLTAADADETSVVSCDKADALQADNVHCEFRPRSCGTPFAAEAAGFVVEITDGKMTRQVFFTGDVQEVFGFSFGADAFSGAVGVRVRHSTDGRPVARTEVFVSGTPDETSVLVCPSDSVRVGESMSCTLSTRSCGRPVPSSVDALVAFSLGGSAIVSAKAVPSRDSFDITFVAGMKSVLGSVEIFVNDVPVATANIAVLDTPDATSNITCERTTVLTYGSVTCSVELRRAGEPAFVAAGSCSVEWLAAV